MKGDLLWVYEGLTNYLGEILTPRSGLWSRRGLSRIARRDRRRTGQQIRPHLASAGRHRRRRAGALRSRRRLPEPAPQRGLLPRGHADLAGSRRHHPPAEQGREVARRFLPRCSTAAPAARRRSSRTPSTTSWPRSTPCSPTIGPASSISACIPPRPHAPLGGIERSGWKLIYDGVRSDFWKAREETRKVIDLTYSIGMLVAVRTARSPTFATAARRRRPASRHP